MSFRESLHKKFKTLDLIFVNDLTGINSIIAFIAITYIWLGLMLLIPNEYHWKFKPQILDYIFGSVFLINAFVHLVNIPYPDLRFMKKVSMLDTFLWLFLGAFTFFGGYFYIYLGLYFLMAMMSSVVYLRIVRKIR